MTPKQRGLAALKMGSSTIGELLADFPKEHIGFQPSPTDVHALWILGHLAVTDEWISKKLDVESVLPESYEKLFGYKSQVMPDIDEYPPINEVRKNFGRTRERLCEAYEAASDAKLAEPVHDTEGDLLGAAFLLCWHDGWHGGQRAASGGHSG